MVAPMDTIASAAMYHDIAAMTIKGQTPKVNEKTGECDNHALTCPSEGVYHANGCGVRRIYFSNILNLLSMLCRL